MEASGGPFSPGNNVGSIDARGLGELVAGETGRLSCGPQHGSRDKPFVILEFHATVARIGRGVCDGGGVHFAAPISAAIVSSGSALG